MDKERIRQLAESADKRGQDHHALYEAAKEASKDYRERDRLGLAAFMDRRAVGYLNDAFYWFGHANACKGIVTLMEREEVGP